MASTNQTYERVPIAFAFGIFACLLHAVVLTPIVSPIWGYLSGLNTVMEPEFGDVIVFDNQLVFPLYRMPAEDIAVLRYVNFATGESRDTEPTQVYVHGLMTNGQTVWGFGLDTRIYETDGTQVDVYQTDFTPPVRPFPFLYEGCPATIDRDPKGDYRLMVLVDRTWEDRGRVVLPHRNPQCRLSVVAANGEFHLFLTEPAHDDPKSKLFVIRHHVGLELVSSPDWEQPASAIDPTNVPTEAEGWERLPLELKVWHGRQIVRDGKIFLCDYEEIKCCTPSSDGAPAKSETVLKSDDRQVQVTLVGPSDSDRVYAIRSHRLGEADVYRWNGSEFEKLPYKLAGVLSPVRRRIGLSLEQIIAVVWIGTLLAVIGAACIVGLVGPPSFAFGQETIPLAPLLRRSLARLIDLMVILLPLIVQLYLRLNDTDSAKFLQMLDLRSGQFRDQYAGFSLVLSAIWAVVAWCALVIASGVWGISLGKWICGVRMVRTTLKPCGIARALLRELMLFLDVPLLLTGLPAVIAWIATEHRQRIGDLSADTIVVSAS